MPGMRHLNVGFSRPEDFSETCRHGLGTRRLFCVPGTEKAYIFYHVCTHWHRHVSGAGGKGRRSLAWSSPGQRKLSHCQNDPRFTAGGSPTEAVPTQAGGGLTQAFDFSLWENMRHINFTILIIFQLTDRCL